MIARRSFIAGSLALLSQPVWAQEPKAERIVRVGAKVVVQDEAIGGIT